MLSGPWRLLLLSDERMENSADKVNNTYEYPIFTPGYPHSCGFCLSVFLLGTERGTQCT